MPVAEMLRRMSASEICEWAAYFGIEPWGSVREDARTALIASTMANLWSKRRYKVEDFMPKYGDPLKRRVQSWQEQLAYVKNVLQPHFERRYEARRLRG